MSLFRNTSPKVSTNGVPPLPSRLTRESDPVPPLETKPLLDRAEDARDKTETVRDTSNLDSQYRSGATPAESCVNVVARGSRWKGSLDIQDSLRIDGYLTGDVTAKGTIHISEVAQVEAKIAADYVVVAGAFKGEIRCQERLELLPKSKVEGEVFAKVLNIHEGAVLDGAVRMSGEKPVVSSPRPAGTNGRLSAIERRSAAEAALTSAEDTSA